MKNAHELMHELVEDHGAWTLLCRSDSVPFDSTRWGIAPASLGKLLIHIGPDYYPFKIGLVPSSIGMMCVDLDFDRKTPSGFGREDADAFAEHLAKKLKLPRKSWKCLPSRNPLNRHMLVKSDHLESDRPSFKCSFGEVIVGWEQSGYICVHSLEELRGIASLARKGRACSWKPAEVAAKFPMQGVPSSTEYRRRNVAHDGRLMFPMKWPTDPKLPWKEKQKGTYMPWQPDCPEHQEKWGEKNDEVGIFEWAKRYLFLCAVCSDKEEWHWAMDRIVENGTLDREKEEKKYGKCGDLERGLWKKGQERRRQLIEDGQEEWQSGDMPIAIGYKWIVDPNGLARRLSKVRKVEQIYWKGMLTEAEYEKIAALIAEAEQERADDKRREKLKRKAAKQAAKKAAAEHEGKKKNG